MPTRPTTEELVAFLREYHNLSAMDVDQYWRSVAPEQLQLVARPIDIKETFKFSRSVSSGPSVTARLTQVFGPTAANRILVIRSIYWQRTGPNQPTSVEIVDVPTGALIWEDDAPASVPLGNQNEPAAFGSRMPIVVYGTETIEFAFVLSPAVSLEFLLAVTGEEFEVPFRNVGT